MLNQKFDIQLYHECYGEHDHDYPQILVPLEGPMEITIGDLEYQVTSQQLCLIPAHTLHQCSYSGKLLVINLTEISPEDRDAVLLSYPVIVSMCGQILELVDLIQKERKQNPEGTSVRYLYSYLYSKLLDNCAAPSIRYLSEHFDLPVTVNQLAEMENYNVTYYNDWFKQQTGCSPSLYLRKMRIDRAKELLLESRYTMMEIALMVGYSSNSTFTRAFHSITGKTPKAFREDNGIVSAG